MKKNKSGKIIAAWLLAALMLISVCLPARGIQATEQTGSVELQLPKGMKDLQMVLYSVADYKDGSFIFSKDFAECNIQITDLNNNEEAQAAAKKLVEYAREHSIAGTVAKPDENGLVKFTGLSPALYLAAQAGGEEAINVQAALVPIPYLGEEGVYIYDAVLSPKYSFPGGAVILNKVDDEGKVVGQVTFTLQEKKYVEEGTEVPAGTEILSDEGGNYFWKEFAASLVTDQNGQIVVTDMPFGDYRFVEVSAPGGIIMSSEPVNFSITKAGQVAVVNGVYAPSEGEAELLTVVNDQTRVVVNKVDQNGNPVPGAKLVIKSADGRALRDADGGALFSFTTGTEPYELRRVPAGTYFLSEVEAPEGYKVSADVPFTVDGSTGAVHEVTMVDEPEDVTEASLRVTKKLMDEHGQELMADDAVFYVALFEDAERTKRVTGVQAVHYHGTDRRDTVTFTNLEPGKTYYVGETDEFGKPMEGMQYDNGIFMPEYPDGYEIMPDTQQENELSFENVFYEIPDGYFYVGRLIVTKRVLKGTEAYNTDQVFYAAIFQDETCTQRYGDVITLDMDGGCETSVTVEGVFIGVNADDSATYYVAETDAEGNVLDPDSRLEYTVSVDQTKITLSPEHSEEEVVITNTFEETPDETPTPSVTAAVTPSAPGHTPNSPGSEGASPVKTGDDTPIGRMAAVLIGAAVVIVAVGVVIYKKKRK